MIHISILAIKRAVLAAITDTYDAFAYTNILLKQMGKPELFNISLVGQGQDVQLNNGLFTIRPDGQIYKEERHDLIVIPPMSGDMISATYLNKDYAGWIADQYKNGTEIASFCVGAFLLAFSGLLKNKQCSTHWDYANEFRSYYPAVQLVEDKIFTADKGIYSSGGNNAYWSLLLYLIEKFTDRPTAIQVAKHFVVDINKVNQTPFVVFKGFKKHDDELIKEIQTYIEQNFTDKITVTDLAEKYHITRRTFERRFLKATHLTVAEYMQRIKIEAAKKLLETGRRSVSEVMVIVGYTDTQSFRDAFKKVTDLTPTAYREKYNIPSA
ncbi:Transcriptional regulator GlxA family, contains an amidase domain and an AraC-type DNA-binding HTH domain [Pedobacter steynii]|uniref:Transcriptional regulator GlxA family, contains an amidase domain and an AraC-type DNA-binding HTH domain n=1 Tax=Pedobacter steynii TaxID=430522 RepID=A0A1H0J1D6_9SPHI|nr:helix-turn-helix domain-containing protein [Pedobacter steynii]NQX42999.1 helix-turn-helix domain-containing protein [Pedobacter steynii]SDO37363.1 Transcriptional regulator GlxA family, contains an amidase domain and an AraC-type DNA-binding HTH domain [Pedobacter steynii]